MSLSIKNHWLDEEDRVYIIFTVEEIMGLMGCKTQKAAKLMKELDSESGIGLIEKKRLGLGKSNVIYVKNFLVKGAGSSERLEGTQDTGNPEIEVGLQGWQAGGDMGIEIQGDQGQSPQAQALKDKDPVLVGIKDCDSQGSKIQDCEDQDLGISGIRNCSSQESLKIKIQGI